VAARRSKLDRGCDGGHVVESCSFASFEDNNTANSIDMSMDEQQFAPLNEAIRQNTANAHLCAQREVVWPDADKRERAMPDLGSARARATGRSNGRNRTVKAPVAQ
jgi:hypothetical protein